MIVVFGAREERSLTNVILVLPLKANLNIMVEDEQFVEPCLQSIALVFVQSIDDFREGANAIE